MKTIDDLIICYADFLHSLRYGRETIRKKRGNLKNFSKWLKEMFDIESVDRLQAEQLKQWHAHLSTLRTHKGYPLKATAINRHIISVRGFLQYLSENGYVQSRILKVLPYLKEGKQLPGSVLTHKQVRKLLSAISTDNAEGYRNRTMFELLYSSGIRAAELLGLDVRDVDLKSHTALVNGKGNKQRVVPVGRTALRYLETYITAVRPFLQKSRSEKALFLGKDGRRLSYQIFRRVVRSVCDQSGLDVYVTAHTFRRSCTTELIRSGANMYHVKELLGHESLDTLKHYAKLTIVDLKKTHEKCHPREIDKR